MTDHRENTKRIAKNTVMLYIRMLFMMFLGLFTSRIVLEALGESDYGVYNVVGGVVAMFAMLSGSLSGAISRFITFELGKVGDSDLNKVYSTSILVQSAITLIVVAVAEPVGLWFINNKMTIDSAMIPAAENVLHFSVLSFAINLMSVPQMASITAHEKMSAYAYIGILDGSLRFVTAILISRSSAEGRLVLYAALMSLCVLLVRIAYGIYCRVSFPDCRFRFVLDKKLLKEMFAFAGWDFIGVSSGVLRDQGGNILINVFASTPAINAARGVAVQLNGVIQGFVSNFMTAVNPQITKSCAGGDYTYMFSLIRKSSRMSYYLLFLLALPVIFNADFLLKIWLKEVPHSTVEFVRLFLVFSLCESLSRPLITSLLAIGNIRNYQLLVGGIQLLNLPVSYMFLKNGYPPEITVSVSIVLSVVCLFIRLILLKVQVGFPMKDYLSRVCLNVALVSLVAVVVPISVRGFLPEGVSGSVINLIIVFLSAALSIFFIGCSLPERKEISSILLNRFKRC